MSATARSTTSRARRIGYLYFDAGFGKEPIPLFQDLSKDLGFTLKLYPVAPADMQNQSAKWLDVRRDKPDFVVMYGWGAMNATAVKEAVKSGFPMDKFISIWWPSEADLTSAGDGAKGFKTLNWHATGTDFPALQDIQKRVVDAGKSLAPASEVGQVLYNHGVYNSMLIAEGIANAQKLTGKKVVTGEDVRRGLETINLDAARFKALGLEGFAAPFKLTCADHNSHSGTFIQQWDGAKWVKITDPIAPGNGQGAAAARRGRQILCRKECRLAGPHRKLRQQVVTQKRPLPLAGEGQGLQPCPPIRNRSRRRSSS